MGQLQFGKRPVEKRVMSMGIDLPWEKKKSVCAKCGTDNSISWHSGDTTSVGHKNAHKDFCRNCWPTILHTGGGERAIMPGTADRKLERSLPSGHFLGPKIKGNDGVRGVFKKVRR